ncbi:MAG: amidase [Pseudomonadota bacterium]
MTTLSSLSAALQSGSTSSRELVEQALARIKTPETEGARAFVYVDDAGARAQADQADRDRKDGNAASPFAGIPISIKDLFDIEDQVTTAGSKVLIGNPPATQDAVAIARLRDAGFVFIGRTNMTEFAYSGVGLNPHYPTPHNPFERGISGGRIPGGSSSGAAIAVADDMVSASIGTDTGGSCRIPAAFCGIVGYKPTARRVDRTGAYPLSGSLDSIGPLANTVDCCAQLDAIMAGSWPRQTSTRDLSNVRLGVLRNYVLEDLDAIVARAFEAALARLAACGIDLVDIELNELEQLPSLNARGGIVAAESFRIHEKLLSAQGDAYDPRVRVRILKAREQGDDEHATLMAARSRMIQAADATTAGLDAVIMPTVPIIPPRFSELEDDADYGRINLLTLRNPSVANILDRCAISLPISARGEPPVGLTVMGETLADDALFALATSLETAVKPAG